MGRRSTRIGVKQASCAPITLMKSGTLRQELVLHDIPGKLIPRGRQSQRFLGRGGRLASILNPASGKVIRMPRHPLRLLPLAARPPAIGPTAYARWRESTRLLGRNQPSHPGTTPIPPGVAGAFFQAPEPIRRRQRRLSGFLGAQNRVSGGPMMRSCPSERRLLGPPRL